MQVSVSGVRRRGIYLREPHEVRRLYQASVTVEPYFTTEAGTNLFNPCQLINKCPYDEVFTCVCWHSKD